LVLIPKLFFDGWFRNGRVVGFSDSRTYRGRGDGRESHSYHPVYVITRLRGDYSQVGADSLIRVRFERWPPRRQPNRLCNANAWHRPALAERHLPHVEQTVCIFDSSHRAIERSAQPSSCRVVDADAFIVLLRLPPYSSCVRGVRRSLSACLCERARAHGVRGAFVCVGCVCFL
jgi:hypothetical protein